MMTLVPWSMLELIIACDRREIRSSLSRPSRFKMLPICAWLSGTKEAKGTDEAKSMRKLPRK